MEAVFVNCSHTHTGPMLGKDLASDLCGNPTSLQAVHTKKAVTRQGHHVLKRVQIILSLKAQLIYLMN